MDIVFLILIGLVAGTLGSLLGLGGGFLVVPVLILVRGLKPEIATGTSIAVIVPAMLTALWRRGSYGHVDWQLAALIAVGAVAGALVGSWLSTQVSAIWIRRLFAGVLVLLAALLAFRDPAPEASTPVPEPLPPARSTP